MRVLIIEDINREVILDKHRLLELWEAARQTQSKETNGSPLEMISSIVTATSLRGSALGSTVSLEYGQLANLNSTHLARKCS
jgi:hypothetical protein